MPGPICFHEKIVKIPFLFVIRIFRGITQVNFMKLRMLLQNGFHPIDYHLNFMFCLCRAFLRLLSLWEPWHIITILCFVIKINSLKLKLSSAYCKNFDLFWLWVAFRIKSCAYSILWTISFLDGVNCFLNAFDLNELFLQFVYHR